MVSKNTKNKSCPYVWSLNGTHIGVTKQCKCMVILGDVPDVPVIFIVHCLGWQYNDRCPTWGRLSQLTKNFSGVLKLPTSPSFRECFIHFHRSSRWIPHQYLHSSRTCHLQLWPPVDQVLSTGISLTKCAIKTLIILSLRGLNSYPLILQVLYKGYL